MRRAVIAVLTVLAITTPASAGFQVAVEAPPGLSIIVRAAAGETREASKLVFESKQPIKSRDESYGVYVENIDLELNEVDLICVTDVTKPIGPDTIFACTKWGKPFRLWEGFDMPIVRMEYKPPS